MSGVSRHARPGRLRPGLWALAVGALLVAGCATGTTDPRAASPADPLTAPAGPPAPEPPATAAPDDATDRLLAAQVERALAGDPALRDAVIEAEVHRGQVTLMGTVPTFRERALAIEAALAVPGVKSVRPQLLLQNP